MKNLFVLLFTPVLLIIFYSCEDKITETYTVNTPVYLSYDELRSSVEVKSAQVMEQPGKIYFKDDYIFVNEYQKGIHVIDNSDRTSPQKVAFIDIPGNVDMAIKGAVLYADSYIDLVTIDISDLQNIQEIDRDTNVFPYIIPEYEGYVEDIDESKGVIIDYTQTTKTEKVDHDRTVFWYFAEYDGVVTTDAIGGDASTTGTSGSMARFTISGDYLYAVDNASLNLFSVADASNPEYSKSIAISWNIETIFPYNNLLFIGSETGMYVYSIENPANPQYISQFWHASSCDPVVVEGDYAYVTLRGGNLCGAIESQLNVLDISTIENPTLIATYSMEEPYGLGIDNGTLFVCDGNAGLKIYNASDPLTIADHLLVQYPDMFAYDVIPLGDVLITIGDDGLYQYDYSDLTDIKLLSFLALE